MAPQPLISVIHLCFREPFPVRHQTAIRVVFGNAMSSFSSIPVYQPKHSHDIFIFFLITPPQKRTPLLACLNAPRALTVPPFPTHALPVMEAHISSSSWINYRCQRDATPTNLRLETLSNVLATTGRYFSLCTCHLNVCLRILS